MKISQGTKISGSFFILLLLLAAVPVLACAYMYNTDTNIGKIEDRFQHYSLDSQIKDSFQGASIAIRDYVDYGDERYLNLYQIRIDRVEKLCMERINDSSNQDKANFEYVLKRTKEYSNQVTQSLVPIIKAKNFEEAKAVNANISPIAAEIIQAVDLQVSDNNKGSNDLISSMNNEVGMEWKIIFLISVFSLFVSIALLLFSVSSFQEI